MPDVAISFTLYVMQSVVKNLVGSTNIHWFGDLETLRPKGPKR